MEDFEKQFDDMDVITKTMEGAMDSSTAAGTPAEEVAPLMFCFQCLCPPLLLPGCLTPIYIYNI